MSQEFKTNELDRRASNIVRFGIIEEVDYTAAKAKIRIGELLSAWLPWLTTRANNNITWNPPEIDEQVVVLCPSGEINQGVILAALYQDAFPNPTQDNTEDHHRITYKDGAVIEYNRDLHHFKIILPTGATLEIVADGGVTIVGDVTVTGKITASDDITSAAHVIDSVRSMQGDRDIYNVHDHAGNVPVPSNQQ